MTQWLIYKHTSLKSNKSYIGLTKVSMERRWIQHISDARKGSETHFHRAIRLYGEGNWEHEIVAENIDTYEEAQALERFYIKKYDSFENGYNLTEGGECRTVIGPIKHKEQIAWVHAEYGVEIMTPWELVQKYTELHIGALVNVLKENTTNKVYKGWQLYEGPDQQLLVEFKEPQAITFYHDIYGEEHCTSECLAKKYKLCTSNVRKLYNGDRLHVNGWRTTKEIIKPTPGKKVYVYTKSYELVHVYDNSYAASLALGFKKKRVSGWLTKNSQYEHNNLIYSYNKRLGA